ncbi:hypothetical protein FXO38_13527 [Capsicum annuum]|nr:hypothetical protein FXO38_13527 [Capsicum annuum]
MLMSSKNEDSLLTLTAEYWDATNALELVLLNHGIKHHSANAPVHLNVLITYQDKATQTDIIEEDTLEKILNTLTTLSMKVDSMGNEIEKLKTNEVKLKFIAKNQLTQQCAELCRSEDIKVPEQEGDDGTLHKTYNAYQSTSAEVKIGLPSYLVDYFGVALVLSVWIAMDKLSLSSLSTSNAAWKMPSMVSNL